MLGLPPVKPVCTSPIAPASLALTNSSQNAVTTKPANIEAIAAARVMRLKNSPPTNVGRNADAHSPKKIAVARAMM